MSAPQLTVALNGISSVSSDTFNTYNQTCNNVADLRAFIGVTGMQVFMRGYVTVNDGGQGNFYWNASATSVTNPDDNGVTNVVPNGTSQGVWTRINTVVQSTVPTTAVPQGRITLVSGTPVMIADATAQSTIYYTPFVGSIIPIYDGTNTVNQTFSELTLNLDNNTGHTGYQASGSLYDLYVFSNSGTLTLGTGVAWSTTSSRGSGAGTAQIILTNGVYTNANAINIRYGGASGDVISVAARRATLVGTMYATANGRTGVQFKPSSASGGSNNVIGIYNIYNQQIAASLCTDSTSSWTYATNSWRPLNNSVSNRVTFVDGLAQIMSRSTLGMTAKVGVATDGAQIGALINSIAATPTMRSIINPNDITGFYYFSVRENFNPILGLNFLQAMENSPNGTTSTFGNFGTQELLYEGVY